MIQNNTRLLQEYLKTTLSQLQGAVWHYSTQALLLYFVMKKANYPNPVFFLIFIQFLISLWSSLTVISDCTFHPLNYKHPLLFNLYPQILELNEKIPA